MQSSNSFMPMWKRTAPIHAMRIDAIEAPHQREPYMWHLVGNVGQQRTHVERVHACFIGMHKPEVGDYLVQLDGGELTVWGREKFERSHERIAEPVPDIDPLAGKVWNGPSVAASEIPRFLVKPESIVPSGKAMDGVDIDRADANSRRFPDGTHGVQK